MRLSKQVPPGFDTCFGSRCLEKSALGMERNISVYRNNCEPGGLVEWVLIVPRAAACLNWVARPKVSFPVLKGLPRAGTSGYSLSRVSAALASSDSGTKGGE